MGDGANAITVRSGSSEFRFPEQCLDPKVSRRDRLCPIGADCEGRAGRLVVAREGARTFAVPVPAAPLNSRIGSDRTIRGLHGFLPPWYESPSIEDRQATVLGFRLPCTAGHRRDDDSDG